MKKMLKAVVLSAAFLTTSAFAGDQLGSICGEAQNHHWDRFTQRLTEFSNDTGNSYSDRQIAQSWITAAGDESTRESAVCQSENGAYIPAITTPSAGGGNGGVDGDEVAIPTQDDLNQEIADRKAGDKTLDDKINDTTAAQAGRDAGQDAALADETKKREDGQQALNDKVDGKVDQTVYDTDKTSQKAIDDDQSGKIADLDNKKVDKGDQVKVDQKQDAAISAETDARIAADKDLDNRKVDKVVQQATDGAQDIAIGNNTKAISNEAKVRANADNELSTRIETNAAKQKTVDTKQNARLDQHDQQITYLDENKASRQELASESQARINGDQRVYDASKGYTNQKFSELRNMVEDNRRKASAGIAGAMGMANIPQVEKGDHFSVGAGIGGFSGEQAIAVGGSVRLSERVITKFSVATNTQHETGWGVGVGYSW